MPKLSVVGSLIEKVVDKVDDFTLDKAEKAQLMQEINKAQLEVNKVEAGQGGLLVRWRPFLGWVLSLAFAYHFVVQPFLLFAFAAGGVNVQLPEFDMTTMTTVLMGMLGLGGLRSYEKVKGRA
jgi:hypothetical protein|tara:strand:+ start:98 stop:466 length:369 start_codon:yes stop_codon:yes gene_type:complete